jgi:hypothetical protein
MSAPIQRPAIDPEHGRPEVLRLVGREGSLRFHIDRATRVLVIYAIGPRGGERGYVSAQPVMAGRIVEWLDGGCDRAAPTSNGALWLEAEGAGAKLTLMMAAGWARRFEMFLNFAQEVELRGLLREWAVQVKRAEGT